MFTHYRIDTLHLTPLSVIHLISWRGAFHEELVFKKCSAFYKIRNSRQSHIIRFHSCLFIHKAFPSWMSSSIKGSVSVFSFHIFALSKFIIGIILIRSCKEQWTLMVRVRLCTEQYCVCPLRGVSVEVMDITDFYCVKSRDHPSEWRHKFLPNTGKWISD
jgi:hypothetical protein